MGVDNQATLGQGGGGASLPFLPPETDEAELGNSGWGRGKRGVGQHFLSHADPMTSYPVSFSPPKKRGGPVSDSALYFRLTGQHTQTYIHIYGFFIQKALKTIW